MVRRSIGGVLQWESFVEKNTFTKKLPTHKDRVIRIANNANMLMLKSPQK
jgi:hypothetical protein